MILAENDATSGPSVLDPSRDEVAAAYQALQEHHLSRSRTPPLPAPDRSLLGDASVVAALSELFHGKCGYCEGVIDVPADVNVDHYRPTSDAIGLDGTVDHAAYWWLTYEWSNLVLSCVDCLKTKGRRFPVEGRRAQYGEGVSGERPVLLSPRSAEDNPERWLIFYADGTVASDDHRGQVTIETLGLNRTRLVEARRAIADTLRFASPAMQVAADAPFLAMQRQVLAERTANPDLSPADTAPEYRAATKSSYLDREVSRSSSTLDDDLGNVEEEVLHDYFSATRWMERVELHNVRPIRDLTLDLSASQATTAPWMMLLGDNGSGKSSILHAVALTLVGDAYRRRLGIRPDEILRRGAKRGHVKIWFTNLSQPVALELVRGATEFTGTTTAPVFVLAYGATRLRTSEAAKPSDVSHIDNLFDPRHELLDPETWLRSLSDEVFAAIVPSLNQLLALEGGTGIGRDDTRVFISYGRSKDPFSDLSDGYQSMLVLACDVIRTTMALWQGPQLAEGVVILDEVGTHLHPRWRMRVVAALRSVLPRMQFFVSTHDPLCLRGLEDGEVTVVNRTVDGDIVTITDLPTVKGLRIDQLLTSEHFGLGSAMDPALDALYQEYYGLRGLKSPNPLQRNRIAELEQQLATLRQLGDTERERLMLRQADAVIALRRQRGSAQVDPAMAQELAAMWKDA